MKRIIALVLAAVALFIFTSCSASLVNFKYENGKLINKGQKLEYYPAPNNYEPVSVGEAFGYYKKTDLVLYEIQGLDPKEWLTQEYAGSATTIFYSTSLTLPTLAELEPTKLYICGGDTLTYAVATVEDKDAIANLIDLFENGEYEEWPLVNSIETFELKFYSEDKYPHIYYNLTYGEFEEGKFIYDRTTKRSVRIDDALIAYIG